MYSSVHSEFSQIPLLLGLRSLNSNGVYLCPQVGLLIKMVWAISPSLLAANPYGMAAVLYV